ncbi:EFR1 family ferrodoxin [Clostridium sp. 'White wine YQ']|uniref:EFR1 family ferrodoxin n=1 Tax=Clostridium sp. 'White wine YQ' TaxID=3027474 RepID=UPI0023660E23|nr:EFR1 family ferrodoxin [Clostridium sp. 'White wine YQ']MDD7793465.1 EFR1 family ferrodoxin [Clostridium sp. 'White wine YQ']
MSKNIIFYFSGTGNSLKVAKDIAATIEDCELISMGKSHKLSGTYERIGFVYPVYGGGLPGAVERFVKALDLAENKSSFIFAVCTSGSGSAGGLTNISKTIDGKGGKLSYGETVRCFSNYVGLYPMGSNADTKAKAQAQATKQVIKDIQSLSVKPPSKNNPMILLHGPFIKWLAKRDKAFNVSEACNSCATCSKVCPVENIKMQDGKPIFLHHCEQCVACVQWCPKQAINIKNKTQNRGRYHHPDITLADMINKKL